MRLEHYPQEKLKKEIREIMGKHLDLTKYRLFVFGSRVSGKGTDRSDIDIGIEGKDPVPYGAMLAIKEEFENLPILYKVEIVDFKNVAPKFREVALEHTEPI